MFFLSGLLPFMVFPRAGNKSCNKYLPVVFPVHMFFGTIFICNPCFRDSLARSYRM